MSECCQGAHVSIGVRLYDEGCPCEPIPALTVHRAVYEEKQGRLSTLDERRGTLYRWACSCGRAGQVWYAERDHARRAFHLHAEYADRPKAARRG